jgi:O-antigen ligase
MSIMLTQSRGGILALATVATLLFLQHRKRAQTLVLTLLAIGTLAITAPVGVWGRMTKLASADTSNLGEIDSSAEARFEVWKVAAAVARDHPVFGVGFGAYELANAAYVRTGQFSFLAGGRKVAHNSYLTLLAETGIFGFLLFMGFLVSLFRMALSRARELDTADPSTAKQLRVMLVGLVGFLQAAVFGSVFHLPFLFMHAGLIISLANLSRPIAVNSEARRFQGRRAPR